MILTVMTRRTVFQLAGAATALPSLSAQTAPLKGRLKQSAARWCYGKMSLDDLAREGARLGLQGIDLLDYKDWPTVQKYGLVPAMTPGTVSIPEGFNRKENHDRLVRETEENITRAAAAKAPNVIAMSGNRRGQADAEGLENCTIGLNRVKKLAEDKGVTVCVELLNSKIDHHDYQCDHTAWGVELIKRVDSPRVKLLYDIYHMQIMEGDIIRTIRQNIQYIGHFHTGGVPGRHELDGTQELQWRSVAEAIVAAGYTGYFAHEFVPTRDPMTSLGEALRLCDV
jgi:hydroxypyruvate isomerase